jgi:steroid delta-isomerase-like uncharacterized protein
MSVENKAVVRRWFEEVWNKGRAAAIDEMLAPNGVIHGLGKSIHGPSEFRTFHAGYRTAFPDVKIHIDDIVAEGDTVAVRWSAMATHGGELLGFSATQKAVKFTGMGFARVQGGKIVEGWNNYDELRIFGDLGIVNLPA